MSRLLARRLTASGLTVAVAESAAGGIISAELTRLGGSSAYFRGGIVAYDDGAKTRLLGLPEDLFVARGSVSPEVCLAMADAARRLFGADLGIGETSVAGPGGGTASKPVGLSYVAVCGGSRQEVRETLLSGSRLQNRQAAARAALALLESLLPPA